MFDVFVDVGGQLEELAAFLGGDAAVAEVVVGFCFGLVAFVAGAEGVAAVVAVQAQQPLVVGLAQFVADAEHPESQVVVACKNLYFFSPAKHNVDQCVYVFWFL